MRLERSLRLLRAANALRLKSSRGEDDRRAYELAREQLAQHDADARSRVDVRQTSIFDALARRT